MFSLEETPKWKPNGITYFVSSTALSLHLEEAWYRGRTQQIFAECMTSAKVLRRVRTQRVLKELIIKIANFYGAPYGPASDVTIRPGFFHSILATMVVTTIILTVQVRKRTLRVR